MKRILLLLALSLLSQPDFATGGPGSPESAPIQVTQSSTVPTVHNQRLDDLYRRFASNNEELNQVNSLVNEFYKNYGTFLASAVIQHELDRQQLYTLFDEDSKTLSRINPELAEEVKGIGPDFYKAVKPNKDRVIQWLEEEYTPKMLQFLSFDHIPTANDVLNKLDDIAEKKVNFTKDDLLTYYVCLDSFKYKYMNNRSDNINLSELIAFKMFVIDKIIFEKSLRNSNFFRKEYYFDKYTGIEGWYGDWMDSVSPRNALKK